MTENIAYAIRIRPTSKCDAVEVSLLGRDEEVLSIAYFDPDMILECIKAMKDAGEAVLYLSDVLVSEAHH